MNIFRKIFTEKVDALGLSVFRMMYAVILFCEILELFKYRHIIYDKIPFVYVGEFRPEFVFGFWAIIIMFLFLGLFTRFTTIVNYIFSVIIFSSTSLFEYHVFYAYVGINFLMIFMPVSRVFSLDSLIDKIKYTNIGRPYRPDRKVLELNYLVPVFVAIGLVYFDSVFYKLSSRMWTDGLGMWMPSSLPMMIWTDTSIILNNEILVRFLGYLVVVFEAIFIFFFWFRRCRVPFVLLGMSLHLGILIAYPIPWFALTGVLVYVLLIPPTFWRRIADGLKSKNPTYKFYYDAECPICNKVIVVIRHFDIFGKIECVTVQGYAENEPALKEIPEMDLLINIHGVDKKGRVYVGYDAYIALLKHMIYTYPKGLFLSLPGISSIGKRVYRYVAGHRLTERCTSENCLMPQYNAPAPETEDFLVKGWNRLAITQKFWKWALIIFTVMQLLLIGISPTIQKFIGNTALGNSFIALYKITDQPFKKFLGIGPHPVFMYNIHFANYKKIFKVVCITNNKLVPLLDENGMVTNSYANGALWVNYTFRTSSAVLRSDIYQSGVEPYLKYFENENGLTNPEYLIYVKDIETTEVWKKDFLHDQMKKPWKPAGRITVEEGKRIFNWTPEMNSYFLDKKSEVISTPIQVP